MIARHTHSSVYRLRPNHGVAFLDIDISASELARIKACFVEETLTVEGHRRAVLLPVSREHMFDDGSAWHPETFQPLGSNEALWLAGYQGIHPLIGHWLPLPYLRVMTTKATADCSVDQGPLNWVRIFISPPDGPLHEAATLKAVLAIDTQLAGSSRLDQRRYNAPSLEDVSLGSTFVLADDTSQLAGLLSEAWLNDWLREVLPRNRVAQTEPDAGSGQFEQEHIAHYVFLLQVLCEACAAPILRFASPARERKTATAAATELVLDLSDDVGLAVLLGHEADAAPSDMGRSCVLPIRDLGQPTRVHAGALPVRVEFDSAPFGYPRISRQSGRSDAFNWASLVRIGDEADRLALRPDALTGTTGTGALARHVHDTAPITSLWRNSSQSGLSASGNVGGASRGTAMKYLTDAGDFIGASTNLQPALRPRFSRSSLVTLFIAELALHAVSVLNAPRKDSEETASKPEFLSTLRLSLPVSIEPSERDSILKRAREGIEFVWHAQGWDSDESGHAPSKPSIELGLGGDFGVQMIYLHNQLNDIYSGDLAAFIEDLDPVRKPLNGEQPALQFASISVGFSATRTVVANYGLTENDGIRPRLVTTKKEPQGLDAVHHAVIDDVLLPAIDAAFRQIDAGLPAGTAHRLLGRTPAFGETEAATFDQFPKDVSLRLKDKVLLPAARALVEIYTGTPADGARGLELLTLANLVKRGGGRLEILADVIDEQTAKIGVDGFRWCQVSVPFSRRNLHQAVLRPLRALLASASSVIDVEQTDLIFVTSTHAATHDVRDLILSLVPISPHRLVMLDEQWDAQQATLGGTAQLAVPIRAGVLSTVIGTRRLLNVKGLASIAQPLQLESEVA